MNINIAGILSAALRMTTPIAYVTLGAVILEKSGISSLCMEGLMIAGSFGGVLGSWFFGNPWMGLLTGVLCSVAIACLRGLFCINFQANQTVCGIGTNIMVSGVTAVFVKMIWGTDGRSAAVSTIPDLHFPFLQNIPVLGEILGTVSPLILLLFPTILIMSFIMNKAVLGLRISTSGEHPHVLSSLGIQVSKVRYTACIIAGILSGIGGAYLSISRLNMFTYDMTAGRGFMAMAACIFGRWGVGSSMFGALLFGFADALQMRLQSYTKYVQFIQMIPYLATLAVLFSMGKKRRDAPAAIGKPYNEQEE